ncbi:Uncharacterized protein OS=Kutzneria albida DSM 43870 GN=KALB_6274 PE=4 SV=1 [Gemmata massiliana]|uniref:Glycosyltransferase RgtA/B/C/D-like domain-containing protein n=2 Tax=Gemmata massiliana TaxID=1210884 RepID=A0A6P2CXJ7_9BACT|nr:Uncharacterized protein OS=Kutzneria albida DSM 43870 GN=KALB_6274 PE=4 SV=1 [Gemmata massiliana]
MVTGGLLRFPTDWDTLMYHLPFVNHWLQAGSLYASGGMRWSDPGNNELITLWIVAPFSGDFLCTLTNLPATILLGCAAVELGRQLGLSVHFRHIAGLAVVSNFVVLKQLIDVENDVAVAALFLSCLSFVLRYVKCGGAEELILGAICFGLLAGVKFYALGYAAVVATTAVLLVAKEAGARSAGRVTAWGLAGFALFGAYWYARNWIADGSPVFPAWAPAASDDLGQSHPTFWQTTFIGNGRPELFRLAIEAVWSMTGPYHLAALLSLPVTLPWLVISGFRQIKHPARSREAAARFGLFFAAIASGLVLLITPFAVEDVPGTLNQMRWKYCPVRYGLCFLSLLVIALSLVMSDIFHNLQLVLGRLGERGLPFTKFFVNLPFALLGAAELAQVYGLSNPESQASYIDNVFIAVDVLLVGWVVFLVARSRFQLTVVFVLSLAAIGGVASAGHQLSERWHQGFAAHYDEMLANGLFMHLRATQPCGSRICVLDLRPYPFFGSARQFRVCQPPHIRSEQWFRTYLHSQKITIVVARLGQDLPLHWMNGQPLLRSDDRRRRLVREGFWVYTVAYVDSD